jgi:uncharacterized sulfatase
MTRRDLLGYAAVAPAVTRAQRAKRPNVLFLVSDDMDCRIGCYGDTVAQTPNLDRLARRGVRFDRAYCQYPLCNPTRSSVLSGRYPTSTGVLDNNTWLVLEDGQYTLPQYFERNGYDVAAHGKVWHGPNRGFRSGETPAQAAWSTPRQRAEQQAKDAAYWDKTQTPYRNMRLANPRAFAWANVFGPLADGDPGVDAPIADAAIASLERLTAGAKPFFLAAGFRRPHVPLTAPRKFFDRFDPARMPLPPDFDTEPRSLPGVPADEFRSNIDLFAGRSFSSLEARGAMAAYYACAAYIDEQLGRVLDKLEATGAASNTIIVFWGDHGWHLSEKGMWAKGTLFEVSARGPLIISAPGTAHGRASRRVVEYLDMFPTLVELCGLPRASWNEGESLARLLADPDAPRDRAAHTVQARSWYVGRSIRTERFRYTEWDEGRRGAALYDHESDPNEMRNLAADLSHSGTVSVLRDRLRSSPVARDPGRI